MSTRSCWSSARAIGAAPCRGCLREARGEPERRAFAGLALDADLAAHLLHELLADREAEAGAAVFPRGRAVGLDECLEELRLRFGRDADAGVAHAESASQRRVSGLLDQFGADHDLALRR